MADIIPFAPRGPASHTPDVESSAGWMHGLAQCDACNYKWIAVGPVGVVCFRCPQCDAPAGRYTEAAYPGKPEDKRVVFACGGCFGHLFLLLPGAIAFCVECGTETTSFWPEPPT